MSTRTRSHSTSETLDDELDADEVFDDVVWDNREICNSCFAVIRDIVEFDTTGWSRSNAPSTETRRSGAGVPGHGIEEHGSPEHRTYPERTFCSECGSESGAAADDPLSRRRALEAARALVDRLQDADVAVDDEALVELVRECKSRPDLQARDTEIFRRATRLGVRRTRRRS